MELTKIDILIDILVIIILLVIALISFAGIGLNRFTAGIGWLLALAWFLIAKF